ncbi:MAG: MTAP family purine nucleoside phosphorylase [Bdellovibrionaceae bacterium]|nr:MTAP family purine nucleoside phosphorylase [Pseudobdellovibrionaceae bacterium]
MWAVIGGSGFEKFGEFEAIADLDRKTPFGLCSEGLKRGKIAGVEVIFLPRHGYHHNLLPSEINYAANIFALKKHGAKQVVAFSAVGSLQEELKPGDMVVPSQYIDRSKGLRRSTFSGFGMVAHVSLAEPVSKPLVAALKSVVHDLPMHSHFYKVALVVEGPYFSSKAESHSYRTLGADIIGMTAFPEYALAREAGMAFLPCSFVTDYDCWKEDIPHVTVNEVMETMKRNNAKAFEVAKRVVHFPTNVVAGANAIELGLKNALMTPIEQMNPEMQEWLAVLTRP